jgi:hypothetical protein
MSGPRSRVRQTCSSVVISHNVIDRNKHDGLGQHEWLAARKMSWTSHCMGPKLIRNGISNELF